MIEYRISGLEMKIEIKNVAKPKLTIAKEEVRVKFPLSYPEPEKDRVLRLTQLILAEVASPVHTLRGSFNVTLGKLCIRLRDTNGSTNLSFYEP